MKINEDIFVNNTKLKDIESGVTGDILTERKLSFKFGDKNIYTKMFTFIIPTTPTSVNGLVNNYEFVFPNGFNISQINVIRQDAVVVTSDGAETVTAISPTDVRPRNANDNDNIGLYFSNWYVRNNKVYFSTYVNRVGWTFYYQVWYTYK